MPTVDDMFPKDHLTAYDLNNEPRVVMIKAITQKKQWDKGVNAEVNKPVIYFHEYQKYCFLSSVIANQIAKALNNRETTDWIGKKVVIYPDKEKAFGELWDVIRVRALKQGERGTAVTPLLEKPMPTNPKPAPSEPRGLAQKPTNGDRFEKPFYSYNKNVAKKTDDELAQILNEHKGNYESALNELKEHHTPS